MDDDKLNKKLSRQGKLLSKLRLARVAYCDGCEEGARITTKMFLTKIEQARADEREKCKKTQCALKYCGGDAFHCEMHELIAIQNARKDAYKKGQAELIEKLKTELMNANYEVFGDHRLTKEQKIAIKKASESLGVSNNAMLDKSEITSESKPEKPDVVKEAVERFERHRKKVK